MRERRTNDSQQFCLIIRESRSETTQGERGPY